MLVSLSTTLLILLNISIRFVKFLTHTDYTVLFSLYQNAILWYTLLKNA
jgi:hypothetical protein